MDRRWEQELTRAADKAIRQQKREQAAGLTQEERDAEYQKVLEAAEQAAAAAGVEPDLLTPSSALEPVRRPDGYFVKADG